MNNRFRKFNIKKQVLLILLCMFYCIKGVSFYATEKDTSDKKSLFKVYFTLGPSTFDVNKLNSALDENGFAKFPEIGGGYSFEVKINKGEKIYFLGSGSKFQNAVRKDNYDLRLEMNNQSIGGGFNYLTTGNLNLSVSSSAGFSRSRFKISKDSLMDKDFAKVLSSNGGTNIVESEDILFVKIGNSFEYEMPIWGYDQYVILGLNAEYLFQLSDPEWPGDNIPFNNINHLYFGLKIGYTIYR